MYRMFPDASLDVDRDFLLTLQTIYGDQDGEYFRSVVFNGTVRFIEASSTFNSRQFFSAFAVVSFLSIIGFAVYQGSRKVIKPSKKGKAQAAAESQTSGSEWSASLVRYFLCMCMQLQVRCGANCAPYLDKRCENNWALFLWLGEGSM